jgi:hypothetical protein
MIVLKGFSDGHPIQPGLFCEQYSANLPAPSSNGGINIPKGADLAENRWSALEAMRALSGHEI